MGRSEALSATLAGAKFDAGKLATNAYFRATPGKPSWQDVVSFAGSECHVTFNNLTEAQLTDVLRAEQGALRSADAEVASLRSTLDTVRFQLGGPFNMIDDVDEDALRYNVRNAIQTIRKVQEATPAGEPLLAECDSLRKQVTLLTRERDNCAESARDAEYRVRQMREALDAINAVRAGDHGPGYHVYIPGEDNHIETMSGPVVIPSEWLRNLLEEAESRGAPSQAECTALETALNLLITESFDEEAPVLQGYLKRLSRPHKEVGAGG